MDRDQRDAAMGRKPAATVFSNAEVFHPFDCSWEQTSVAVEGGLVVGLGDYRGASEIDLRGARVVPGLIDAHVHIESSLLAPAEFARVVLRHGTTTVVADPHEIANVCGAEGIAYLLRERQGTPLDIMVMLPSCVPATPDDEGGASLSAADLGRFLGQEGVLGLGEMMNVPGVLAGDPAVMAKIALCPVVDGHAPLLSGKELSAYLLAGPGSDHECTTADEAAEKIRRGMYLFLREGSMARDLAALVPAVTPCNAPRCSFATDDRHPDVLVDQGHVDDCIRTAIILGLEPELALRMATLSPAERFGLRDRGALAPGRIADFCVLRPGRDFLVDRTFKRGVLVTDPGYREPSAIRTPFRCTIPAVEDLAIRGSGDARVIGLVRDSILTRALVDHVDGDQLPDPGRDLLKAVVCDRYREAGFATGIVHGFGLTEGAIAGSVAHDAHNLVAAGAGDADIVRAMRGVAAAGGGLAFARRGRCTLLPLPCAGLMSVRPAEEVARLLRELEGEAGAAGSMPHPFMYLSFLALTVIPALRLTARGLFDVQDRAVVPVFLDR